MEDVTFDPVWAAGGSSITPLYALIGERVIAMSAEGAAKLRRQRVRFANEDEYPVRPVETVHDLKSNSVRMILRGD